MRAHAFDEPDLVAVHVVLQVAVEAGKEPQLEKLVHRGEYRDWAELLTSGDVGPDFIQRAKSCLEDVFHPADDVPSPQVSEKVQVFRVFEPRIAEPVEGQSLIRLADTLQSLNLLIGERREAREVFRERRDADCRPGYLLEHSKTILDYVLLSGVKFVVVIKIADHDPAVPSGRVDDRQAADKREGDPGVLAAQVLVDYGLKIGERVLLVRLLREADSDLDEVWFASLQSLEEPEELVQVLAVELSELAHSQASDGAGNLEVRRARSVALVAQLTDDEGVVGETVSPLGATAQELKVCSEDPVRLRFESSHFTDSAKGRSIRRQDPHMLDGSLAGVEISAHDDKGLRLVAHEVSDELIYRFEYFLLLLEVTQVNI